MQTSAVFEFLGMQQIVRLRYSPLVGGPSRRPTFVISVTNVLLDFFISPLFQFLSQIYLTLLFIQFFTCAFLAGAKSQCMSEFDQGQGIESIDLRHSAQG